MQLIRAQAMHTTTRQMMPMEAKLPYLRGRHRARPAKPAVARADASGSRDQTAKAIALWPWARVALCVLLVALSAWPAVQDGFASLRLTFGDTDDAARLVQVREFMAGAGWYDLVLARIGGATPLVSHWSRLIDAPIAGLITLFSFVMAPATAELAARVAWPSLLLLSLLLMVSREAEARGGIAAAILVIVLSATTLSSLAQFRPGRIDHHNVMILATLAGVLLFSRAVAAPRLAWPAGAAFGFALVIGYEPLAFIAPMACAAALVALRDPRWLLPTRNAATSMTAALIFGLLTASPPTLWHLAACDAIGINLVALSAVATLGLWTAGMAPQVARLALATAFATGAVGIAYLVNPSCAAGPFGGLSAEARALWFATVSENQPIWVMAKLNPVPMIAFAVLALAGLMAAVQRARAVRTAESVALLVSMIWLAVLSATMMKFVAYAGLLAAFCLGLGLARAVDDGRLSARMKQLLAVCTLNQVTVAVAISLSGVTAASSVQSTHGACATPAAVATLAPLTKGLVVAPIDVGPAIVAATDHDVLAGPYHRIGAALATNEAIFRSPTAEAGARLKAAGATYLAACLPAGAAPQKNEAAGSLMSALRAGQTLPYLTPVDAKPATALRIWRVVP